MTRATGGQPLDGAFERTHAGELTAGNPERNSYVDSVRTLAIVFVVIGHWIATAVVYRPGRFEGVDVLGVVPWTSWLTLLLQTVPLFFLVGGYANAASWSKHQADGEQWASWVRRRVLGLLFPTAAYAALIAAAMWGCQLAGVNRPELDQVGWALGLHLWFLAAYMLVLLLTPALYAAHRRAGLLVPVVMCVAAAAIDVGVIEGHWHLVGWTNYLLVWGVFHQLGFAWHDGSFGGAATRRRPPILLGCAVFALVALIWWGPYPVSMVGVPGARIQNASPPSNALLAFGLAQVALAVTCAGVTNRLLDRHPTARRSLIRAGSLTMPVYLWHMVPLVAVAVAVYPTHLFTQPDIGSGRWWAQRAGWVGLLAVVLVGLLGLVALLGRVWRRFAGGAEAAEQRWAAVCGARLALLIAGIVAAAFGIGRLAVDGFSPGGRLAVLSLLLLAAGLLAVQWSGRFANGGERVR